MMEVNTTPLSVGVYICTRC